MAMISEQDKVNIVDIAYRYDAGEFCTELSTNNQ